MMYGAVLFISLVILLYGAVRFAVAKWRKEDNPGIHILWIPASAFFYALSVAVLVWVVQ